MPARVGSPLTLDGNQKDDARGLLEGFLNREPSIRKTSLEIVERKGTDGRKEWEDSGGEDEATQTSLEVLGPW